MLNFLKRRSKTEGQSTIGRLMEAPAAANKVKLRKERYLKRVKTLQLVLPAVRRKEESVIEVWDATRFEAIANLWAAPGFDQALIADTKKHGKQNQGIFQIDFTTDYRQDSSPIGGTCLGIKYVFDYLAAVGEEVFDPQTAPSKLKIHGKRISDQFKQQVAANEAEWDRFHFDQAGGREIQNIPQTIFQILWADVTRLSKSIAICAKFGPNYQTGAEYRRVLAKSRPDELKRIVELERTVLPLSDPDEILDQE